MGYKRMKKKLGKIVPGSGEPSGFTGLGGNSFQADIARGLGKTVPSDGELHNYTGPGGNSFQADMARGLGKDKPQGLHSDPTQLPGSFNGFGTAPAQNDISSGFDIGRIDNSMSPDWNKKRERKKNILDEWVEHAEGGGGQY